LMGLPIESLLVAVNANDIMARVLTTGDYRRGAAQATQSPAMDIQVASNFERLLFECSGRDAALVGEAFRAFASERAMTVPATVLAAMRQVFHAVAVDETLTASTIAEALAMTGELLDPHTAVAMAGADHARPSESGAPLIVVSTAHPAKFPEAVTAAAGVSPPPPAAVRIRAEAPERIDRLPADVEAVKRYVRDFAAA
jgi:threonine synthase